jgi:hypothetical protein
MGAAGGIAHVDRASTPAIAPASLRGSITATTSTPATARSAATCRPLSVVTNKAARLPGATAKRLM